MWVPLSHPFVMGVSIINHPAIGISPFDNKHGRIMIKIVFILVPLCSIIAHLLLLSSHSYSALIFSRRLFSSLTLPTSAFPSVHIGSLTSKLPSIIIFYPRVQQMVFPYFLNHGTVFHSEFNRWSSPKSKEPSKVVANRTRPAASSSSEVKFMGKPAASSMMRNDS